LSENIEDVIVSKGPRSELGFRSNLVIVVAAVICGCAAGWLASADRYSTTFSIAVEAAVTVVFWALLYFFSRFEF
jgi:hypothetical protein